MQRRCAHRRCKVRLEGVLDVTHAGRALAKEDSYDVEPQGIEGWLSIEEVVFGEGADLSLFTRGDGLQRVSEAGSAAQLHLDEDEGRAASDYEVELPVAGAVVALHQGVASPGQIAQRELLAPGAGGSILQAPTPA